MFLRWPTQKTNPQNPRISEPPNSLCGGGEVRTHIAAAAEGKGVKNRREAGVNLRLSVCREIQNGGTKGRAENH